MGKMPYIPLYIGDWEQDVNAISIEAEGALLKLTFKLWKSPTKGVIEIAFDSLSKLLKTDEKTAVKILTELQENDVLNIEFISDSKAKIQSRRMIKEALKSAKNAENGKKGGRGKKTTEKRIKSESKAKVKRIPENEYEIENENKVLKGVQGEKNFALVFPHGSEEFLKLWIAWVDHRKAMKKPYHTDSQQLMELQMLATHPEHVACQMIRDAIRNVWMNLRPLELVPVDKASAPKFSGPRKKGE